MRELNSKNSIRFSFLFGAIFLLALSTYIDQVLSLPTDASGQWPTFPRRNIAALARDGYLRSAASSFKRSISTLAKNGQLPTFRSPYSEATKSEQDDEESHDKRNLASIARLRSYTALKRNIQSLARDGYRVGRGHYNQGNAKRNIAALARNGMIHKRNELVGDEYYYPFFRNQMPQLSEAVGAYDVNEMYDFQEAGNPEAAVSRIFKRDEMDSVLYPDSYQEMDYNGNWYLKRGTAGLPAHGLYRPTYIEPATRAKRYILSMPDVIDTNDIETSENDDNENEDKRSVDEDDVRDNFAKRHIGSLARLGLLPSFRFSGGRYSRSGRARLLLPSQELYRKHSADENFGIRQYISGPEADAAIDTDDTDLPPPPILAHTHPTGRYLHRPLNDAPSSTYTQSATNNIDTNTKNWEINSKDVPRFYYFRSQKVPYRSSKRYLLLPAVDNIMLRKNYRNSSLPSRRKNQ